MQDNDIQHNTVFSAEGQFGGWPANNGIWRFGDEILVGFIQADHKEKTGHTYDATTARRKFARSRDGGLTWTVEDAFAQGIKGKATDHNLGEQAVEPIECPGAIDFTRPDFAFTFDRMNNSDGPSSFYHSSDRGRIWQGPFVFPTFDTAGIASRTDYMVEGKHRMLVFLTAAKSDHKEGRVLCAETVDGAKSWKKLSWIGPEETGFAIMPASVRLAPEKILVVTRRKDPERAWLDAYISQDNGKTWNRLPEPASDLGGGNPPAMVKLSDGRLCLAYGVRTAPASRMCVKFSEDGGESWSREYVVRGNDGASGDMGYPRMTQRPDGKVVLVYYYNNSLLGGSPYRYIAATIFDPDRLG